MRTLTGSVKHKVQYIQRRNHSQNYNRIIRSIHRSIYYPRYQITKSPQHPPTLRFKYALPLHAATPIQTTTNKQNTILHAISRNWIQCEAPPTHHEHSWRPNLIATHRAHGGQGALRWQAKKKVPRHGGNNVGKGAPPWKKGDGL